MGIASFPTWNLWDLKNYFAHAGSTHGFGNIMSQYDYVDNKAAVNETLHEIFVTEEEHFIANSRSTDIVKAIQVPAVNVHPKSDLQQ
jgi:hypothetical protein